MKKVLLVDDDAEDHDIIRHGFEEVGFLDQAHFEDNGENTLVYLENRLLQNLPLLCIIVLDLNMPLLNGTQTLKRISNLKIFKSSSTQLL